MEFCISSVPCGDGAAGAGFRSIAGDLEDRAARMGDAEAFRFYPDSAHRDPAAPFDRWSWAELRARARGVARELARSGRVGRGDRVLLAYPAGLDFVAALMGCFYLGAVPVPVSPPRPREKFSRWGHVSRDAGVSAILCARVNRDSLMRMMPGTDPLIAAAADPSIPYAPRPDDPLPPAFGPDDLAFLQYTSGSTSAPKGVMVTHGMLAANLAQIRLAFRFGPDDRIVGWLPHYHDMGLIGGILTPVHLGIPNAMMSPGAFLRDPIRYLELAGQAGATVLGGPNFSYDHCLRNATPEALARVDLSRLRLAFSGAEPIRPETLRRFQQVFAPCGFTPAHWVDCYGLAEATLCVSVTPPGEGVRLVDGTADSGVPVAGQEIAICGPEGRVADGTIGEIWLRGPNVASGYWRKPEDSAVFDQRLDGQGGWMRTGDLGCLRDGRLFVTGRLKEVVIVHGQNHAPHDLEATVAEAHAAILPGRVAAFQSGDGGLGLIAELDRHACRDLTPEPVFAAIRAALADRHGIVPRQIALARPGSLPVTPSGKIQRLACRDGLAGGGLPEGGLAVWHAGPSAIGSADTPGRFPATAATSADAVGSASADATRSGDLARALRAAPQPLRRSRLLAHLRAALAQPTGRDDIADDQRFFDIGLDSVSGVALVGDLERALDLRLDATLIYEHATPAALADHLLAQLFAPATQS